MTRIYCSVLLLLYGAMAFAQKRDFIRTPNTNNIIVDANLKASISLLVPHDTTSSLRGAPDSAGYLKFNPKTQTFQGYYGDAKGWQNIGGGVDSSNVIIAGGAISSTPTVGYNPGSKISVAQWIAAAYYQSQPPTAYLSGGNTYELTSASTQTANVNYSYGKQSATQNIATATINGSTTGVTQSATGASGSVSETFNTNITTTFTLLVTTVDGKTATASTSFSYQPKRYWGYSTSTSPTSAELLAAAGGGSGLSTSHAGTFTITASGSNHPFFAYPTSEGTITQIKDANGFDVTTSFTVTTPVSFTNASGYTQNYTVVTLTNATAGNYTMTTN